MEKSKTQVVYIPHGGGPMPILGSGGHEHLTPFLKDLGTKLQKPSRILVISAHWEEETFTVTSGKNPELIYDYYGFPKEAYELKYPAPGDPIFAGKVSETLKQNNIDCRLDTKRGFDHGTYIPLLLMYSAADIPVIQISLKKGLNPTAHLALGKALAKELEPGTLVVGSGMSFHNMRSFGPNASTTKEGIEFNSWLSKICTDSSIPPSTVEKGLVEWNKAPQAKFCHPREEHLIPLHVCYGIAMEKSPHGELIFDKTVLGQKCLGLLWSS